MKTCILVFTQPSTWQQLASPLHRLLRYWASYRRAGMGLTQRRIIFFMLQLAASRFFWTILNPRKWCPSWGSTNAMETIVHEPRTRRRTISVCYFEPPLSDVFLASTKTALNLRPNRPNEPRFIFGEPNFMFWLFLLYPRKFQVFILASTNAMEIAIVHELA